MDTTYNSCNTARVGALRGSSEKNILKVFTQSTAFLETFTTMIHGSG